MELKNNQIEYGSNYNFEIVRLPYKRKDYSDKEGGLYFSILLPRKRFGLKKALQKLKSCSLRGLFEQIQSEKTFHKLRSDKPKGLLGQMRVEMGFRNINFNVSNGRFGHMQSREVHASFQADNLNFDYLVVHAQIYP